ncbi:putative transcription factor interactor and regulator CCHC(Zn) family [Helianthus annuus]|uniref:Transcription factor interactor and regulator CCHC(Zn) family n=1 Tax=Helianthus annuus TaxID=4232 RepID=A0A9K3IH97_HELAN|nr:putative transcription factor interactor and regulator CCHC(Zn) family [Helianthus annuus]KAJ0902686.1 putative transcription factor interactor and regulator CCHC(Zn) family [Helianthus annuus]
MTKEDYDQIDPEELELIDIKWGMASIVRRAQRFMEITRRSSLAGPDPKLGFDKSKVTCFKCKEKGHFKRECPNREVNNHQNQFANDYYRQAIYYKNSQQPFNPRPQIENSPSKQTEKALLVNQDDEKIPEGFSWDKYVLGSGLAMMAEIVEEQELEIEECFPEIEEVSEVMNEKSFADLEEEAAAVYYYQSENEYEVEQTPVQEIIDVSKEMNEKTLNEIANKALMVKLLEVEQTKTPSDNNETKYATQESVLIEKESIIETCDTYESGEKSESDGKSENVKSESGEKSESVSGEFGKSESKNDKQENVFEKVDPILEKPCENCLKPCMDCLEKDKQFQELKKFNDKLKFDFNDVKEAYDTLS